MEKGYIKVEKFKNKETHKFLWWTYEADIYESIFVKVNIIGKKETSRIEPDDPIREKYLISYPANGKDDDGEWIIVEVNADELYL